MAWLGESMPRRGVGAAAASGARAGRSRDIAAGKQVEARRVGGMVGHRPEHVTVTP
jgi:hypothetical protein